MATRREFLGSGMTAAALLASGWTLPGFLARTARAALPLRDERILVVIQLTGGNDGLNTVVPYGDDRYHRSRPTLRVREEAALKLSGPGGVDGLGLHPAMTAMKDLYDRGQLTVVTNVGYPNPDRSHFRSMDIWHTASMKPEGREDGWLGRYVDRTWKEGKAPPALVLDDTPLPLALKARSLSVPTVGNIDSFRLGGLGDDVTGAMRAVRKNAAEDLLFVQRTLIESVENAHRIESIAREPAAGRSYPNYGLAARLGQIEQLICAGFGARVYYTSLGGFDTHSKQGLTHEPLLRELSESMAAFMAGLKARGLEDRVLVLTYSEFGRRLKENGSQGTDHGAAAPMFLAGPAARSVSGAVGGVMGGVVGGGIDLGDLDEGDVKHRIDFRSVYASVLKGWLEVEPGPILDGMFEPARVLG
ncbi:MAG TPA: DUF1501 domain-containing protein [Phycisphaerales bacterium]|nr:DUF1501 domain-containing protein [Phycisphaerales bacterium]